MTMSVLPLTGRYGNDDSDFQSLIDYRGHRYHIALLYNENADQNVAENVVLQRLYDAFDANNEADIEQAVCECEDFVYPFMKTGWEAQSHGWTTAITAASDGVVKLRLDDSDFYCLKSVHRNSNESFIHEISVLRKCLHPISRIFSA